VTRNVNVNVSVSVSVSGSGSGRHSSVRLEPDLWEALRDIAAREDRSMHQVCSDIDRTCGDARLTSAMRIYIVHYFRSAANPS
jgi:predicted DNA-binding ribbon-helix-helix protein